MTSDPAHASEGANDPEPTLKADDAPDVVIPEHLNRPHLRRILPQPVANGKQQGVALRDPLGLADRTMVVAPTVMQALQHLNGDWTLEQIAAHGKTDPKNILDLVRSLDEVGLLWGPTCEALEVSKREALHRDGVLPLRQGGLIGNEPAAVASQIDQWLQDTEDPEVDCTVRGLLSPRLDPRAMWPVYAATFHAARTANCDRVLLLGNNHYGLGDGVCLTRAGVQSALGRLEADTDMIDALVKVLGDDVLRDELDHIADHGCEMQAPWITSALGGVPVVCALLPDPLAEPIDDDDEQRCSPQAFIDAARTVIDQLDGTTLVIATGDLSHVGRQFGEPRMVDDQRRTEVEQHDRELLATLMSGDVEALDGAIAWHRNPTKWSCLGAARAMIGIVQPTSMELIDYRQQPIDEEGNAMISAAGVAAGIA
jgi:AmmeMemoRadiSam system protein B